MYQIRQVAGSLTDHYDPRNKTLNLSNLYTIRRQSRQSVLRRMKCGHAIEDNTEYTFACAALWCRW